MEKEYLYLKDLPENETGFTNKYFGISREDFINTAFPTMIKHSEGIDLPEGYVPCTEFFLWDDDTIVGLFRIRHCLNEALRDGSGHIGYGIAKQFRKKGYATQGLALTIKKAWEIIQEDEIYMSVRKDNIASLKVQMNNGAYIHHEDSTHYFTRISH